MRAFECEHVHSSSWKKNKMFENYEMQILAVPVRYFLCIPLIYADPLINNLL